MTIEVVKNEIVAIELSGESITIGDEAVSVGCTEGDGIYNFQGLNIIIRNGNVKLFKLMEGEFKISFVQKKDDDDFDMISKDEFEERVAETMAEVELLKQKMEIANTSEEKAEILAHMQELTEQMNLRR